MSLDQDLQQQQERKEETEILTGEAMSENQSQIQDNDIEDSFLAQEVKRLQNEILVVLAESENSRIRHQKQLQETKDYSVTEFAKEMVRVLDNLNMALAQNIDTNDEVVKNVILGVQMTKDELVKIFSKYGISEILPKLGDNFDSHLHYAISREETDSYPGNTIVKVMQIGYKLKDRLLRPAMVVVAYKN